MKAKILLLTAIAAAIVYSCSTERDEQEQAPVSQKVELDALKTNNKNETSKVSDSVDLPDHQFSTPPSTGLDPNPDPNEPTDPEIVHPGDVKPPKP